MFQMKLSGFEGCTKNVLTYLLKLKGRIIGSGDILILIL